MQSIPPLRLTLTRLALLGSLSLLASCQTFTDGDQQLYDQSNRLLDESLAQSRGSGCSAKAGAKRVCRGRSDRGARAGGNRGNQNQSSRKPSRGLRRAVRKMPRPAAQQETVFEVNRCLYRRLVSHLRVVHAGKAEQGTNIFSFEIKVKFFIAIGFKGLRARSPHGAPTGPTAPTWSRRSARPAPARRGALQTKGPANAPQSPRR